ncbi:MAG: glycosyltransferase family 2 protein [Bacteroidales bacterium]|nr:glycosyltransferase family 2 protein [Bacteroidales bacterium]
MKISGFTMVKNAGKLYYPIREVILSVLPIVDEFIVALGDCDSDDNTRAIIESINSDKIKIIDTVWDIEKYPDGMENAHQTDIAKSYCAGDWLIHLQADEVIHEKYHQTILENCEKYLDDKRVEGFLFHYKHFFGDYYHCIDFHGWYPYEIRIIRNMPDIHSFQSAQTFRRIPDFDGLSYRKKEGTFKLKVKLLDAYIYHYGWVRPPELMQKKSKALDTIHKGETIAGKMYGLRPEYFDWGCLYDVPEFRETHPAVMRDMVNKFYWKDFLHFERGYVPKNRPLMKHERRKYRFLTFIEKHLLGGRQLFAYSNWKLLK